MEYCGHIHTYYPNQHRFVASHKIPANFVPRGEVSRIVRDTTAISASCWRTTATSLISTAHKHRSSPGLWGLKCSEWQNGTGGIKMSICPHDVLRAYHRPRKLGTQVKSHKDTLGFTRILNLCPHAFNRYWRDPRIFCG
jgi:hypothetical protein